MNAKDKMFSEVCEENKRLKAEIEALRAPRDAHGNVISLGSVIQRVDNPSQRGVVTRIIKKDEPSDIITGCPGDIHVLTSPGCTTVSCQYGQWKHITHDDQNYSERFHSWRLREKRDEPEDKDFFITAVLSLLPELGDYDDYHYDVCSAMEMLATELTKAEGRSND